MKNNRPKVGLGVCIKNKNGEVLLLQRQNAHGANSWSFPGGHLEFGESWEQCARRETKEEAGIEIKNVKFLGLTNDIMKDENLHYITIFMSAEVKSGIAKIMEPEKSSAIGWFKPNKLPKPYFNPLKNYLRKYKSL